MSTSAADSGYCVRCLKTNARPSRREDLQRTLQFLLLAPVLSCSVGDGVGIDRVGLLGRSSEGEEGGEGEDDGGGMHFGVDYVRSLYV